MIFTTDHGELQGDFGLLFKGPYHVDGLMRLPLIWKPAQLVERQPVDGLEAGRVGRTSPRRSARSPASPCRSGWRALALPVDDADADARGFERVLTEWDSELFGVDVHLRTIMRDGWVCSTYQPGYSHDGTEGEMYDLVDDPLQQVNRWDDPSLSSLRGDLLADLWDHQPADAHAVATGRGAGLTASFRPWRCAYAATGGPAR